MFTLTSEATSETATETTTEPHPLPADSSFRVREARPPDREAVRAVHGASVRELGRAAYDDEQVAAWDHDRDPDDYAVAEPGVTFVVAERLGERAVEPTADSDREPSDGSTDELLGFAEVRPSGGEYFERVPEEYGEVRAVYVHPDTARSGVGSRLQQ